jgi:hypothetical protein
MFKCNLTKILKKVWKNRLILDGVIAKKLNGNENGKRLYIISGFLGSNEGVSMRTMYSLQKARLTMLRES